MFELRQEYDRKGKFYWIVIVDFRSFTLKMEKKNFLRVENKRKFETKYF